MSTVTTSGDPVRRQLAEMMMNRPKLKLIYSSEKKEEEDRAQPERMTNGAFAQVLFTLKSSLFYLAHCDTSQGCRSRLSAATNT